MIPEIRGEGDTPFGTDRGACLTEQTRSIAEDSGSAQVRACEGLRSTQNVVPRYELLFCRISFSYCP